MNELLSMSIKIHIFFVFITLLIAIINFYIMKNYQNYIAMTKKYEFFTPLYYLSLSIIIFTGFVILAVYKFQMSYSIYFMVFTSIVIIVGAFKNHKLFKQTRVKDINSQKIFKQFAIKKFLLDIIFIVLAIILAFIVK